MGAEQGTPTFQISQERAPENAVVAGFAQFGLAGLTAVDFLADYLPLSPVGHVTARDLPTITPFEEGRPRHHTRLFGDETVPVTVLVGELFVPVWAAEPFGDAIIGWVEANDVDEVVVLAGVPVAHAPDDHRTFYIATEDYHDARIEGTDVPPMGRGFLDGVNAGLVERGMLTDLRVGLLVTPVHARTPDVEAAIRLVETVAALYDLDVDVGPLETFASDIAQHYADLQERLEAAEDGAQRSVPEDRMYM